MIYKIRDKYCVKVGSKYYEVELIYKQNDIDLKSTTNVVPYTNEDNIECYIFLEYKKELLKEYYNKKFNQPKEINEKHESKKRFRI